MYRRKGEGYGCRFKREEGNMGAVLTGNRNIEYWNEDCMIGMARYPDKWFDLAITDPPYGGDDAIGVQDGNTHVAKRTDYKLFENVAPPPEYFEELFRVSKHQIIWGANHYKNVNLAGGRLVWDKKGTVFGRAEEAYLSMTNSVNIVEIVWNGMLQHDMKNKEYRIHPTQKPVALYKWLLTNYAKPGDLILDTHVGSASSLIACHDLGFSAVGFEIDEEYYRISRERLENHMKQIRIEDLLCNQN
jgi:site-specific DNA-methyltransferase (adenine-specific)